jgi:hypothetical protein
MRKLAGSRVLERHDDGHVRAVLRKSGRPLTVLEISSWTRVPAERCAAALLRLAVAGGALPQSGGWRA